MKKIKIMGVLNLTPDSFYDGNQKMLLNKETLQKKINTLVRSDIIDVGCESSRPGSIPISDKEEIARLSFFINNIPKYKGVFSIDTYKYSVAKYALNNGFKMINDIYAGRYEKGRIFELAYDFNIPIVLVHMRANPLNMQKNITYNSIIRDILDFFKRRIQKAKGYGIPDKNIIIDPGIGFGKSSKDNFIILKNIDKFKKLGYKVLIGLSRKAFLFEKGDSPKDRLPATIAMNAVSVMNGADILRVHDVCESIQIRNVLGKYINS